jgi:hypothetical protein
MTTISDSFSWGWAPRHDDTSSPHIHGYLCRRKREFIITWLITRPSWMATYNPSHLTNSLADRSSPQDRYWICSPLHNVRKHFLTLTAVGILCVTIIILIMIQFLFVCVLTQQPRGQLQSEHEWKRDADTKYKAIYNIRVMMIRNRNYDLGGNVIITLLLLLLLSLLLLAVPGHALLWLSLGKWKRKKRESARL